MEQPVTSPAGTAAPSKHLIVNGFMATGKTTLGQALASHLDMPFLDLDQEVERRTGRSVSEIFRERGEAAFRTVEREALGDALSAEPTVISLGGGALLDEESRDKTEASGFIVTLTATPEEIGRRVGSDPSRPLLKTSESAGEDPIARIRALLESRSHLYDAYPCFSADGHDVLGDIERAFRGRATSGAAYCLRFPGGEVTTVSFAAIPLGHSMWDGQEVVVVTDETVKRLCIRVLGGDPSGPMPEIVEAPRGEAGKTMESLVRIYSRIRQAGLQRDGAVIGLGGGSICDLAGMAAATYMRGIDLALIPTTLLAQIDAAIGGKTGIDFEGEKNMVGAFHPAVDVFVIPEVLTSLPPAEIRAGLSEMIKVAFVNDSGLITRLEGIANQVDVLIDTVAIRRAIRNKVEIVNEDPYERTGVRSLLNFGHTIGHAVESASGYAISHGECVAIGMVAEARLAAQLGYLNQSVVDRLVTLVARFGLPVELPSIDEMALLAAMRRDKKGSGGTMRMVMLTAPGSAYIEQMTEPEVRSFLRTQGGVVS